jgi:hypothetical protein
MVMIRPLLPACAQERMCMTEIREVGRIFFVEKSKTSFTKIEGAIGNGEKVIMVAVYVVVENGVPYPVAYASFESAVAVVKEKHKETLEEQMREADGGSICSDVDVPENKLTGHTYLYVEKEIHINIYLLPCM